MEKNYIVRIYKFEKDTPEDEEKTLTGLVEEPMTGMRQSFHTREELWSILSENDGQNEPSPQP